jgi:ComF family protein
MTLLGALLDVAFPPRCAACRELLDATERPVPAFSFCAGCDATVQPHDSGCATCGLSGEDSPCDACAGAPPAFASVQAVWTYGGAIADVLRRYKYQDRPEFAGPLAEAMSRLPLAVPDVVVPVPMHPSRRRERTYDQALYLARALARRGGWPLARALVRVRSTRRQVGQQRAERLANLAGAFVVAAPEAVRGRAVLLVDDVVTTTATVRECAGVLVAAGAARVDVAAAARA